MGYNLPTAERLNVMNTKRTHQVTFRLSDEELSSFRKKVSSSGCNQQEYLRKVALGKDITNLDALKEVLPEMKRQGVNLNQIAKKLNERGYVDYENVLASSLKEVEDTWRLLRQYLHTHQ